MKIFEQYRTLGVNEYYEQFGDEYNNPHADRVKSVLDKIWNPEWSTGLDFACGDGLVSKYLPSTNWIGVDKYLFERYSEETGHECLPYSFVDIVQSAVSILPKVDVVVCSYAWDLIPTSMEQILSYQLATISDNLILIRPNKHTLISDFHSEVYSVRSQQTTAKLYKSRLRVM